MYLLDANHCGRHLAGDPRMLQRFTELGSMAIATCAIVAGELIFMAEKSERRHANLQLIYGFLQDIAVYPIDQETAVPYGELKAALLLHFGPKERAKRRQYTIERLGFTENDLWIAALARQHDLIVVSADRDFVRMAEETDLAVEAWWHPDTSR
ncbi:MAG: type II toxin-antitoxin system VapC family toxin [Dehalococcoidia bacterium]